MEANTTMEVEMETDYHHLSPYLTAIQSLNGQKPGEKYTQLNTTIKTIVATYQQTGDLVSVMDSQGIPNAMRPLVQILVGNELKSREAVVEALKSSDIPVVNKALRAKWFFHGSNDFINIDYFKTNILPFVSLRTRLGIIKVLSRGLLGFQEKAESFFNSFHDMYGLEQSLPFLPYCKENSIFHIIMKHEIVLSTRMLDTLYKSYPDLVIRYLGLGMTQEKSNEEDRKIHSFDLAIYKDFLPKLIKNRGQDYVKLARYTPSKVGSKRIDYLFKNSFDFIIEQASYFIDKYPLKMFHYKLTTKQFEQFYTNLFPAHTPYFELERFLKYLIYYPKEARLDFLLNIYTLKYKESFLETLSYRKDIKTIFTSNVYNLITQQQFEILYYYTHPPFVHQFNVKKMLFCLQHYPKDKQLNLLLTTYKLHYSKDLLKNKIEVLKSKKLLKLLPEVERAALAQQFVNQCEKNSSEYYEWCCYLPLEVSFSIFVKAVNFSGPLKKIEFLKKLIHSCQIYDNQEHLLKVLTYYNNRYKNVNPSFLYKILEYLIEQFEIKSLNKSNWLIFFEMVQRAYIKNELFRAPNQLIEKIFEDTLHRLFVDQKETESDTEIFLDKTISVFIEYKIEVQDSTDWIILKHFPELEIKCIEKLLHKIPQIYPEEHSVWKESNKKCTVVTKLIRKLYYYNLNIQKNKKKHGWTKAQVDEKITRLNNYPWLRVFAIELLTSQDENTNITDFKKLVKQYDRSFYLSTIISSSRTINPRTILTGQAGMALKKDQNKILKRWKEYLLACQKLLNSKGGARAAKKFILSIKWYNELPIKFVEHCILETKQTGNMTILALLLEGEVLSKVLSQYIPKEPSVDIYKADIKEFYKLVSSIPTAINVTMPPVSSEFLIRIFQGEYVKLAKRSVTNFGQRVEKPKVLTFAMQLISKPVSVKKSGIRLIFQVASTDELFEFLRILSNEKHCNSISREIAQNVVKRFKKCPTDKSWALVEFYITGLKGNDDGALKVLSKINSIDNSYAPLYIDTLLNKVDDLAEKKEISMKSKEKWNITIIKSIGESMLPYLSKKTIVNILRKYYFKAESETMFDSTRSLAQKIFSRPFIGQK